MINRILIVDDEGSLLRSMNRALSARYDVTTAYSAEEALTLLETRSFPVVLTDMRMPGGDGLWLIDQAAQRFPLTRFVVLTGHCDDLARQSALGSGRVDAFLTKPCSTDEMERSLDKSLEKHAQLCGI